MNRGVLSSASCVAATFLASRKGRIFVLLRRPAAGAKRTVLVIPPLAEEMNKSRRMITLASQALVQQGHAVAVVDLFGTGDSDGEFDQADWETWQADVRRAVEWCAQEGSPVSGVLAIRLGCALACTALQGGAPIEKAVLWQPVFDGARWLDQFLRLRVAASMMEEDRKETVSELRRALSGGNVVDVAGYPIPPTLAAQLIALKSAETCTAALGRITWMEVTRGAEAGVSAASTAILDKLRATGASLDVQGIPGQPFWASTEIVEVPELVDATARAFGVAA